mmetsp:Transcript_42695/g.84538  ORF Transcript_42695/g.84538 Transcript_42695/m.84538 type:complete len:254 (-) Transcript_42695:543-1304(-)
MVRTGNCVNFVFGFMSFHCVGMSTRSSMYGTPPKANAKRTHSPPPSTLKYVNLMLGNLLLSLGGGVNIMISLTLHGTKRTLPSGRTAQSVDTRGPEWCADDPAFPCGRDCHVRFWGSKTTMEGLSNGTKTTRPSGSSLQPFHFIPSPKLPTSSQLLSSGENKRAELFFSGANSSLPSGSSSLPDHLKLPGKFPTISQDLLRESKRRMDELANGMKTTLPSGSILHPFHLALPSNLPTSSHVFVVGSKSTIEEW